MKLDEFVNHLRVYLGQSAIPPAVMEIEKGVYLRVGAEGVRIVTEHTINGPIAVQELPESSIPGMRAEYATCQTCKEPFLRIYMPSLECWTGACKPCALTEELRVRARDEFTSSATHQRTFARRMQEKIAEHADEIAPEVEVRLRKYVEAIRPELENDVLMQLRAHYHHEVESEIISEITEELRRKESVLR
jgi:hypothetical protein